MYLLGSTFFMCWSLLFSLVICFTEICCYCIITCMLIYITSQRNVFIRKFVTKGLLHQFYTLNLHVLGSITANVKKSCEEPFVAPEEAACNLMIENCCDDCWVLLCITVMYVLCYLCICVGTPSKTRPSQGVILNRLKWKLKKKKKEIKIFLKSFL